VLARAASRTNAIVSVIAAVCALVATIGAALLPEIERRWRLLGWGPP
jgi:hypothetical protein